MKSGEMEKSFHMEIIYTEEITKYIVLNTVKRLKVKSIKAFTDYGAMVI